MIHLIFSLTRPINDVYLCRNLHLSPKDEAPGFTGDSYLSTSIPVVPNTPVMFAHSGDTPKLQLKASEFA